LLKHRYPIGGNAIELTVLWAQAAARAEVCLSPAEHESERHYEGAARVPRDQEFGMLRLYLSAWWVLARDRFAKCVVVGKW